MSEDLQQIVTPEGSDSPRLSKMQRFLICECGCEIYRYKPEKVPDKELVREALFTIFNSSDERIRGRIESVINNAYLYLESVAIDFKIVPDEKTFQDPYNTREDELIEKARESNNYNEEDIRELKRLLKQNSFRKGPTASVQMWLEFLLNQINNSEQSGSVLNQLHGNLKSLHEEFKIQLENATNLTQVTADKRMEFVIKFKNLISEALVDLTTSKSETPNLKA